MAVSSETSVNFYHGILCHITEDPSHSLPQYTVSYHTRPFPFPTTVYCVISQKTLSIPCHGILCHITQDPSHYLPWYTVSYHRRPLPIPYHDNLISDHVMYKSKVTTMVILNCQLTENGKVQFLLFHARNNTYSLCCSRSATTVYLCCWLFMPMMLPACSFT